MGYGSSLIWLSVLLLVPEAHSTSLIMEEETTIKSIINSFSISMSFKNSVVGVRPFTQCFRHVPLIRRRHDPFGSVSFPIPFTSEPNGTLR